MQSCWCLGFSTEGRRMRDRPSRRNYPGALKTTPQDNSAGLQTRGWYRVSPKDESNGETVLRSKPFGRLAFPRTATLSAACGGDAAQCYPTSCCRKWVSSCRHSLRGRKVCSPVLGPPWQMTEWDFGKTQAPYTR